MYLDGPDRSAVAGARLQSGYIVLYLYHARHCDCLCKSEERANKAGDVQPTLRSSFDGECKKKIDEESIDARLYGLMSSDGVQCSGPRGKQAKAYPLSAFVSSTLSSLPSSVSLLALRDPSHVLITHRFLFCIYHPLNSALACFPATRTTFRYK